MGIVPIQLRVQLLEYLKLHLEVNVDIGLKGLTKMTAFLLKTFWDKKEPFTKSSQCFEVLFPVIKWKKGETGSKSIWKSHVPKHLPLNDQLLK